MVAAVGGGTAVVAGVEVEVEEVERHPETGDVTVDSLRRSPRSHPAVAASAAVRWPPERLAAAVLAAVDASVVVWPGSVAFLDESTVVAFRVTGTASESFSVVHSLDSLCTLLLRLLLLHPHCQTTQQPVAWRR